MTKKGIPIGIDDFKILIERQGYFVDKSLFIKEILDDISAVKLITRPRRFGKTLNISMLKYFFEKTNADTSQLFRNLKIWKQGEEYIRHQGQYPIISLTFKDVKYRAFDNCLENLNSIIGEEYRNHKYLLEDDNIDEFDKVQYIEICNEKAGYVKLSTSLKLLIRLLYQYHKKEIIVLMDEYDTPINHGYISGYYDDIIDFMRNFLGGGLKGNPNLKTAVIIGIYRVAKESIFSGFNNLKVCSVIHDFYSDKFGFTGEEVEEILTYYGAGEKMENVKDWYNGYVLGDHTEIYNPWSIMNYAEQKKLQPYWVNTSSNDIIRDILIRTDTGVKKKIKLLIEGQEIKDVTVNTDMNFRDIQNKDVIVGDVLWNILLVSGYLKPENLRLELGRTKCDMRIPNREIALLYEDTISDWFRNGEITGERIRELLYNLVEGDMDKFIKGFEHVVRKTFSYFDVGENTSENFYHAFILGILVNLDGRYKVKSNIESGDGRPDLLIIPNDKTKKGVVIEFKVVESGDARLMEEKAKEALQQMKLKKYKEEIINSGIREVLEVAIVFFKKKVHIDFYQN